MANIYSVNLEEKNILALQKAGYLDANRKVKKGKKLSNIMNFAIFKLLGSEIDRVVNEISLLENKREKLNEKKKEMEFEKRPLDLEINEINEKIKVLADKIGDIKNKNEELAEKEVKAQIQTSE